MTEKKDKEYFMNLLEKGRDELNRDSKWPSSRLEFIAEEVFGYNASGATGILEKLARKSIEICEHLNMVHINMNVDERKLGEDYQDEISKFTNKGSKFYTEENWEWFIIILNMPFFKHCTSYGTSIKGTFWDPNYYYPNYSPTNNCDFLMCFSSLEIETKDAKDGLLNLSLEEWVNFIDALIEFSKRVDFIDALIELSKINQLTISTGQPEVT